MESGKEEWSRERLLGDVCSDSPNPQCCLPYFVSAGTTDRIRDAAVYFRVAYKKVNGVYVISTYQSPMGDIRSQSN